MTMRTDLAIAGSASGATPLAGVRSRPGDEAAPAAEPGAAAAPADHSGAEAHRGRWLYGPAVDFLLLGGGSFIVLAAMAAFFPRDEASRVALAGAMLFLAHFVNHPHFAHSYQIFYRGFVRKAFPSPRRSDFPQAEDRDKDPPPGERFGLREEQASAHGLATGPEPETTGTRPGEACSSDGRSLISTTASSTTSCGGARTPERACIWRLYLFTASGRSAQSEGGAARPTPAANTAGSLRSTHT